MLKTAWLRASDNLSEGEGPIDMPNGLKKYTIVDQKISQQKSMHQKPKTPRVFYDGLEDAKQIDLAKP